MEINRRELVKSAAVMAIVACLGEVVAAAEDGNPSATLVDAGEVGEFAREGVHDKLARDRHILIVRRAGRLTAISVECTHRSCALKPAAAGGELRCPCHGSRFASDGTATRGPAVTPLPRYGISVRDGRVFVDKSKTFSPEQADAEGSYVKA